MFLNQRNLIMWLLLVFMDVHLLPILYSKRTEKELKMKLLEELEKKTALRKVKKCWRLSLKRERL